MSQNHVFYQEKEVGPTALQRFSREHFHFLDLKLAMFSVHQKYNQCLGNSINPPRFLLEINCQRHLSKQRGKLV